MDQIFLLIVADPSSKYAVYKLLSARWFGNPVPFVILS